MFQRKQTRGSFQSCRYKLAIVLQRGVSPPIAILLESEVRNERAIASAAATAIICSFALRDVCSYVERDVWHGDSRSEEYGDNREGPGSELLHINESN